MRKAGMWKRKISIAKETTPPKHDMVTVWGKRLLKNSVRRKKKLETDKKNLRESVKGNASILPAHIFDLSTLDDVFMVPRSWF